MSSNDRFQQYDITDEPQQGLDNRVLKHEGQFETSVASFEFPELDETGKGEYDAIRKTYGPLAITDPDRRKLENRDGQFKLNELLREPLGLEEEERKAIEHIVQDRIESISAEVRHQAEKDGYQEGLKRGHEEAFKEFQKEGAGRLAEFEGFLKSFEGAKEDIFKENEEFLIELSFRIAKKLFLKELDTDREYLLRLATEIIKRVGVKDNIRININPRDLECAEMLKEGISDLIGDLKNIEVESSDNVGLGGCVVETQWNTIDASIENQLDGILKSLIDRGKKGKLVQSEEETPFEIVAADDAFDSEEGSKPEPEGEPQS